MKKMEDEGGIDTKAIAAYAEKDGVFTERMAELAEVTDKRDGVRGRYDDLRKRRLDEFMEGFMAISLKLKEMYQMITLGGDAELELVDTLDPFSEVCFPAAMPCACLWVNPTPGRGWQAACDHGSCGAALLNGVPGV